LFNKGCFSQPKTRRNGINVQVLVRDNNVDQALRALKKKMQREGIFREMKMRDFYEKPSQKRAREKAEAVRRVRKLARKRAQREGLIGGGRTGAFSLISRFFALLGCMHMEAGTKIRLRLFAHKCGWPGI
jgi:small subunit ribosomal protein S21